MLILAKQKQLQRNYNICRYRCVSAYDQRNLVPSVAGIQKPIQTSKCWSNLERRRRLVVEEILQLTASAQVPRQGRNDAEDACYEIPRGQEHEHSRRTTADDGECVPGKIPLCNRLLKISRFKVFDCIFLYCNLLISCSKSHARTCTSNTIKYVSCILLK